ncbi:hypothetical protein CAPTEDRAFT_94680 [Capitella teleta]|uniref:Uncharacterized protein n=1 Tax=Capitella teleta TaxID=283909 RepID=R7V8D5_CAPTE|nr:hypothetical protein CAPTEDRAFT_94680 [Capitella teleta]|eukprot:ELU12025.1 hypothetical protein CAPTEDRAFT_94680 [Capitella teleta]
MADEEASSPREIHNNPHFAVVCSFFQRYGLILGLPDLSFNQLQVWIEDTRQLNRNFQEILLKLLRRWKSNVSVDRLEKTLIKFCYTYSQVDAWELEEFGFQRCKLSTKLRILKNLVEGQFDFNTKFKEKINDLTATDLRFLPLGRDSTGLAYWFLLDNDFNVRVYREQQDDVDSETWEMVVR